jgi:replicative DNA helicase
MSEEAAPVAQPKSHRDLLMAKQNGFDVEDFKLFLWRREEELIRSAIAYPQQYANSGLEVGHFEAPMHRVAWQAFESLVTTYPEMEKLDGGSFVSEMLSAAPEIAAGAMNWMLSLLNELPVNPEIGIDQIVRDLFYHARLRNWSSVQKRYFARIGKDTNLADLQASIVSTSRDVVYAYEGEGRVSPPLSSLAWDARDREKISVVKTGIDAIDRAAGGGHGRGELLVWGGGTSHGKSFAMQRLLRNQAEMGQSALYVSCEDALELMQCRMLADYCSDISPKDIRMRTADPERVEAAFEKMRQELGDRVTVVEHKKPTVSQVCNLVRYYKYARKVDLVIIDYLQAINDDNPSGQKTMDTANVIAKLKKCFTECKVAGVVLTQYARNEYREGEEPSINAAKYAGDIENEAEVLVFMWKDKDDTLHVKLPKVKWSRAKSLRYKIPVNPITGCHGAWQDDFDD